jgi:hypothetical protein
MSRFAHVGQNCILNHGQALAGRPATEEYSDPSRSMASARPGLIFAWLTGAVQANREFISPEGLRLDGRRPREIRKTSCKVRTARVGLMLDRLVRARH